MPKRKKRALTVTSNKKKKSKEAEPEVEESDDDQFEARAILEERAIKRGKKKVIYYLVDWEGIDPETGNKYEPNWAEAENVGDALIDEWEEERRRAQAALNENDEQPLEQPLAQPDSELPSAEANEQELVLSDIPPPIPKTGNKRRREASPASSSSGRSDRTKRRRISTVDIAVELPKSPGFDPKDYTTVAPSQTTIPDSQDLQESFPSAAATVGDQDTNSELRSSTSTHLSTALPSQAAVEDVSQGLDLSQPAAHVTELDHQQPHHYQTNSEPSVSRPDTPKEQLETSHLSFGERQVVTATNSQQSLTLSPEVSGAESSSHTEGPTSSQDFLTQPEIGVESQPLERSFPATAQKTSEFIADSNGGSLDAANRHETDGQKTQDSLSGPVHSAQIVQPFSSVPDDLLTPSQRETLPSDRIIPASSQDQAPQASFTASSAAAVRSRSVPSDAIVWDTPIRRAHSTPRGLSSVPRSQIVTQIPVEQSPSLDVDLRASIEKVVERTIEVIEEIEESIEETTEQIVEQTITQCLEDTAERTVEEVIEETVKLTISQSVEETLEETVEEVIEQTAEETTEGVIGQTAEETLEQIDENTIETAGSRTVSPATGNQLIVEPTPNNTPPLRVSADPRRANSDRIISTSTSSSISKPTPKTPTMDPREDAEAAAALTSGNLTGFLAQLHRSHKAKKRLSQDLEFSTPDLDHAVEHDQDSAAQRVTTEGPHDEPAAPDHVLHSSSADAHHFGNPLGLASAPADAMRTDDESYQLPVTIAPSQLEMFAPESSLHHTLPLATQPLFRNEDVEHETILPGIESRHVSVDPEPESSSPSVAESTGDRSNQFLVTLPMLASTRGLYAATVRSNSSAMKKYGNYFASDSGENPDEELVAEVDDIFRRLHDHCDLPQFADSLPPLYSEALMRHATGTNSKYSFFYELLLELGDSDQRLLVLSQPGVAAESLEAICQCGESRHMELHRYMDSEAINGPVDLGGFTVILGTTEMDVTNLPDVETVILFDSKAREVWQDRTFGGIVLSLVVAHSIEHIELQVSQHVPDKADDLERRSAIGFALAVSQSAISSPGSMPPPNKLAAQFANFIKDPTRELDWEPKAIPEHWFDAYVKSQSQRAPLISLPNGRKRPLDGDDRLSTPMKRARTAPSSLVETSYPMSDLLKDTLSSYTRRSQGSSHTVEVAIDQLEWMVAKMSRLENELLSKSRVEEQMREEIKKLELQLKSFNKTINRLQVKYKEAISDRGVFEIEVTATEREAAKLRDDLEKSRAETQALVEKLAARTPSDLEAKYEEAVVKAESLEKKLQVGAKEMEFLRERYQEVSTAAGPLLNENSELKERIGKLEYKAGENIIRVHEINSANTIRELQHRLDESQAITTSREQQLARLETELRNYKSTRRETRSSSVPRSPRLGVMSPRARGGGGNTSRGNSPAPLDGGSTPSSAAGPVPGMTFYQPPSSHHQRFSHLRE